MRIQSVEPYRKKKILVCLEGKGKFALYLSEGKRYSIAENGELSEEEYQVLLKEVLIPRGRRRILHLLERMDRPEEELRRKLKADYLPEEVVEDAVAYAKKFHYIDDERYISSYLSYQLKKKSRRQVEMELEHKGIERERIRQAVALYKDENPESELETVLKLLNRKLRNSTESQDVLKAKQYLFRKGFSYDSIERAVNIYLQER